jgi:hypothetical protein
VNKRYIESARKVGLQRVTIRAGNVPDHMNLNARMPLVCEVLDGRKFAESSRVHVADRKGPRQGANVWLTFDVLP